MFSNRLSQVLLATAVLGLGASWSDLGVGQARPHKAAVRAERATKIDQKAVETQLRSRNPEAIHAGLETLRQAGAGAASLAPSAETLLHDGLPTDLAIEAIRALAAIGATSSSKVLAERAKDRDVQVRREACRALSKTRGQLAVAALRRCLSDADAGVRGIAASALGSLGAKEQVPDLFIALDHKVVEAADAIGQLCAQAQCEQLLDRTGQIALDILGPGFDQILFRTGPEVPEELKIKVVGRVRELGTAESHRLLKDIQSRWPTKASRKVKQAIDQGVIATSGASGTTSGVVPGKDEARTAEADFAASNDRGAL